MSDSTICPECGQIGRPISYGYPTPETFRHGERGETASEPAGEPASAAKECPQGHTWSGGTDQLG